LLSPSQPEVEVVVKLSHSLVGGIGKAFLLGADLACQGVFRLGEKILPLFYKLFFDNQKFRICNHIHDLFVQYKRAVTADVAKQPFEI
jgi:hypothetical protein